MSTVIVREAKAYFGLIIVEFGNPPAVVNSHAGVEQVIQFDTVSVWMVCILSTKDPYLSLSKYIRLSKY